MSNGIKSYASESYVNQSVEPIQTKVQTLETEITIKMQTLETEITDVTSLSEKFAVIDENDNDTVTDAETVLTTSQIYDGLNNTSTTLPLSANQGNVLDKKIAVERARIDKFTSLVEGSTTGDAELIDLRIGADGVTYDNAGTAVRTQISNLSEQIDNLNMGQPAVVSKVSEMIDTTKIYLYAGSETGYVSGDWYYYNGSTWTSGGQYGSITLLMADEEKY